MRCSVECGKRRVWIVENEECVVACGVRQGRGMEFGRETAREEGGVGNLGARPRARKKGGGAG